MTTQKSLILPLSAIAETATIIMNFPLLLLASSWFMIDRPRRSHYNEASDDGIIHLLTPISPCLD